MVESSECSRYDERWRNWGKNKRAHTSCALVKVSRPRLEHRDSEIRHLWAQLPPNHKFKATKQHRWQLMLTIEKAITRSQKQQTWNYLTFPSKFLFKLHLRYKLFQRIQTNLLKLQRSNLWITLGRFWNRQDVHTHKYVWMPKEAKNGSFGLVSRRAHSRVCRCWIS